MQQDYNVTISFAEYKKLMDERVFLHKEIFLLTMEKTNLRYQLMLKNSLEDILKTRGEHEHP